ncbi:YcaO-like family protein [bacterium]|nr:YcaO-like family protein [bacterium]
MEYSIYKDTTPIETVNKIKSVLKELSIDINEKEITHKENDVTSVRLTVKGTQIGTNGKGTNRENALASGYSEFMERLQTNYLFSFRTKEIDEVEADVKSLPDYFESVLKKKLNKKFRKLIIIKNKIKQIKSGENYEVSEDESKTECVKFYALNAKKEVLIPINDLRYIQTTTGLAAGNTFEEASVQALSELCERYSMKQILTKKIRLPEVPLKYYQERTSIVELVKFIESQGYRVTIKDASLGTKHRGKININPPVICTLFERKDADGEDCQLRFGSHPSLFVAIERTLTEFMQGYSLEEEKEREYVKLFRDLKTSSINDKLSDFFHSVVVFSKHKKDYSFLFDKKSDYEFDEATWLIDQKSSNKEMLKRLCTIGKEVYIRNYSFLGFPTVNIFIPELICSRDLDEKYLDNEIKISELELEILSGEVKSHSVKELLKIFEYGLSTVYEYHLSSVPLCYLAFLCAVMLKNNKKALEYYKQIKVNIDFNKKYGEENILKNNILIEYYDLLSKWGNDKKIFNILYETFEKQIKMHYNIDKEYFDKKAFERLFINTLTSRKILKLLTDNSKIGNNFDKKEHIVNNIVFIYNKNRLSHDIFEGKN